jgi:hypothetical protein
MDLAELWSSLRKGSFAKTGVTQACIFTVVENFVENIS